MLSELIESIFDDEKGCKHVPIEFHLKQRKFFKGSFRK